MFDVFYPTPSRTSAGGEDPRILMTFSTPNLQLVLRTF